MSYLVASNGGAVDAGEIAKVAGRNEAAVGNFTPL